MYIFSFFIVRFLLYSSSPSVKSASWENTWLQFTCLDEHNRHILAIYLVNWKGQLFASCAFFWGGMSLRFFLNKIKQFPHLFQTWRAVWVHWKKENAVKYILWSNQHYFSLVIFYSVTKGAPFLAVHCHSNTCPKYTTLIAEVVSSLYGCYLRLTPYFNLQPGQYPLSSLTCWYKSDFSPNQCDLPHTLVSICLFFFDFDKKNLPAET